MYVAAQLQFTALLHWSHLVKVTDRGFRLQIGLVAAQQAAEAVVGVVFKKTGQQQTQSHSQEPF